MAVTREKFNQGMTYDQFLDSMTRNRDRIEGYEAKVQISPDDLKFFKDLPRTLDTLVIGADWEGNPVTQVRWMLTYVVAHYASPCKAWTFWQAHHYY